MNTNLYNEIRYQFKNQLDVNTTICIVTSDKLQADLDFALKQPSCQLVIINYSVSYLKELSRFRKSDTKVKIVNLQRYYALEEIFNTIHLLANTPKLALLRDGILTEWKVPQDIPEKQVDILFISGYPIDSVTTFHNCGVLTEMFSTIGISCKTIYHSPCPSIELLNSVKLIVVYRAASPLLIDQLKKTTTPKAFLTDDDTLSSTPGISSAVKQQTLNSINACDFCLTYTQNLKKVFSKIKPTYYIGSPYVSEELFKKLNVCLPQNKTNEFSIGIVSGIAHKEKLKRFINNLVKAAQDKKITIVYFGDIEPNVPPNITLKKINYQNTWSDYYNKLHSLKLDIIYVELDNTPIAKSKTNLKYREAALMKSCLVAVDPQGCTYPGIQNYYNGVVTNDTQEAIKVIRALIANKKLTNEIGQNAYNEYTSTKVEIIATSIIRQINNATSKPTLQCSELPIVYTPFFREGGPKTFNDNLKSSKFHNTHNLYLPVIDMMIACAFYPTEIDFSQLEYHLEKQVKLYHRLGGVTDDLNVLKHMKRLNDKAIDSVFVCKFLQEHYEKLGFKRGKVIYNGINLKNYIARHNKRINLLSINHTFLPSRQLEKIQQIAKNLPLDFNLTVVGNYGNLDFNYSNVEKCETSNNVSQYFRGQHYFIFPSVNEGYSHIVLEAIASGIPVIYNSHNNGGTAEAVSQAGFSWDFTRSPKELFEKIREVDYDYLYNKTLERRNEITADKMVLEYQLLLE